MRNIEENSAPEDVDDRKCFLWDNMSYHETPYVMNTIYVHTSVQEFINIDRPPYRPKMSLIEFLFC